MNPQTQANRTRVEVAEQRLIVRGVYVGYIYLFSLGLSGFLMTPVMLSYLGQSAYGLWAAFNSIIGYLMLFNFGMNAASIKYTAEYRALTDQETLNKILSSVFVGLAILGLLIVLVSAGLSPLLPRVFAVPKDLVKAGSIAFMILGSTVGLRLVGSVFGNVIYGYQRVDVLKAFGIVQLVANALFTVAFLHLGFGLIGVALAVLLSFLMLTALHLSYVRHSSPEIKIQPRLASVRIFKQIAPYSIRSFFLGLTSQILYQTDSIIIGVFLGTALVTPYAVAFTLLFTVKYLFTIIPETVFPRFSQLYTQGNMDELRRLYLRATKIPIAIMVPVGLFLGFRGQQFIGLWVGEENFVGMDVLTVLIAMQFVHAYTGAGAVLLQGIGNNKGLTYSEMINAALNLLLSIILVRTMGVLGVALGTIAAHLMTSSWVVPLLACKQAKLPIHRYILSGILPPVLAGIPAGAVMWVLARELPFGNSFVDLGLKGLMVVALYSVIYLAFAATREERQMYFCLFKGIAGA